MNYVSRSSSGLEFEGLTMSFVVGSRGTACPVLAPPYFSKLHTVLFFGLLKSEVY